MTTNLTEAVNRLRVKSALNPMLWVCGIICIPTLIVISRWQGEVPSWLIALVFIPVCAVVAGFFILLFRDPDKLQSEEYQLRKQSLEIVQDKGGRLQLLPASIDAISNPSLPALPGLREAEE